MVAQRAVRQGTAEGELDGWRHALRFGSLVGAILGVLILGAFLRTNPTSAIAPQEAQVERPRTVRPALLTQAPDLGPVQVAAQAPAPALATTDLPGRARADLARLTRLGGGFTAQLAVLCDEDSARTLLERFARETELYIVPTQVKNRPCYILSWSHYDTKDSAIAAQDLPQGLRAVQPKPFPRSVNEIAR